MKHSVALVGVAGIFILGCLCGLMAMHLYEAWDDTPDGRPFKLGHGHGGRHARSHIEFLTHHLDLTPEQTEQVEEIRLRCHAKGKRIHQEMLPRVRALMDESGDQIKEILTPEQLAAWRESGAAMQALVEGQLQQAGMMFGNE